jgi:hypothetical protein
MLATILNGLAYDFVKKEYVNKSGTKKRKNMSPVEMSSKAKLKSNGDKAAPCFRLF